MTIHSGQIQCHLLSAKIIVKGKTKVSFSFLEDTVCEQTLTGAAAPTQAHSLGVSTVILFKTHLIASF